MTHFYVLLEDTYVLSLSAYPLVELSLSLSQLKYHTWIQLIRATGDFPFTPGFDATFHGSSHLHQQAYFSPSMRSHNSAFYAMHLLWYVSFIYSNCSINQVFSIHFILTG